MDERLKKQLDFALEIDKEKNIFRQTHLSGHGRNENDAEHAWHMAIIYIIFFHHILHSAVKRSYFLAFSNISLMQILLLFVSLFFRLIIVYHYFFNIQIIYIQKTRSF